MMTTLNPTPRAGAFDEAQAAAYANISYVKTAEFANPGTGPGDFRVGQVVALHSRGGIRTAVVTKVGTKNVTVVYTTQGSVDEALRVVEMARSELAKTDEAIRAEAKAAAVVSWDREQAHIRSLRVRYPEREHLNVYRRFWKGDANPSDQEIVDSIAEDYYQNAIARRTRCQGYVDEGWEAHVHFTTKTAKFQEVGR